MKLKFPNGLSKLIHRARDAASRPRHGKASAAEPTEALPPRKPVESRATTPRATTQTAVMAPRACARPSFTMANAPGADAEFPNSLAARMLQQAADRTGNPELLVFNVRAPRTPSTPHAVDPPEPARKASAEVPACLQTWTDWLMEGAAEQTTDPDEHVFVNASPSRQPPATARPNPLGENVPRLRSGAKVPCRLAPISEESPLFDASAIMTRAGRKESAPEVARWRQRDRLPRAAVHKIQAVAEGVAGLGYGPARGIKRGVLEPLADQVKPMLDRTLAASSKPLIDGPQFRFKKQGWYGVQSDFPNLAEGAAHNFEVIRKLSPRTSTARKAFEKLECAQSATASKVPPHQKEQLARQAEYRKEHTLGLARLRLNPLVSVRVKKGRITAQPQLTGLSGSERRLGRQRAREARNLVNMAGNPAIDIVAHGPSQGELVRYKNGDLRWVKSPGAHLPLAVFNTLRWANGPSVEPASPPPLELQGGVLHAGSRAWCLNEGTLYRFTNARWEVASTPHAIQSLTRELDGSVWARSQKGRLHEVTPQGLGPPVLFVGQHDDPCVRILPRRPKKSDESVHALVLGHDRNVSLCSRQEQKGLTARKVLFRADPDLSEIALPQENRIFGYSRPPVPI